jgi:aspartate/methionine/tyrosine aminotransferase
MFPRTEYLRWAIARHARIRLDLAISGMPGFELDEVAPPVSRGPDPKNAVAELRGRIAKAHGLSVGRVLPTLGTSHALWVAYAAMLSAGDVALVEAPHYEPLRVAAQSLGATVHTFERSRAEGYAVNVDRVAAAITDRTKVIALSNLHNPSGVRADEGTLRALARIAAGRGITLLVDEVYAPFDSFLDGERLVHSASTYGENVVTVSSLTKCFGAGAHRVGWLTGSEELVAAAEDVLLTTLGHLPVTHAQVGVRLFDALPTLALRSQRLLGQKRERVRQWMKEEDLGFSAPSSGLFGLAWPKRHLGDLRARIEQGLDIHGVLVTPGVFFGEPDAFRIAWSLPEAQLDIALETLGRVLSASG